jgi:hypothetical protein
MKDVIINVITILVAGTFSMFLVGKFANWLSGRGKV